MQPRIEPEVVFGINAPVPVRDDPSAVLACVEWIAPGFEIVQSYFPDWKFKAPDCTAAFGLHGALVVGTPVPVTAANRAALADMLPTFALTLSQFPSLAAGEIITTGTITDAWPVAPGETWSSDYGLLGLAGLTLTFS